MGLMHVETGPSSAAFHVTVNPLPAPGVAITGPDNVCRGLENVEYITDPIANSSEYFWSFSGNGAHIRNMGDHAYISFDSVATTGTLMVYGHNDCGDGGPAVFQVTLKQQPRRPVVTYSLDTLRSNAPEGNQWYSLTTGIINGATEPTYKPTEKRKLFCIGYSKRCVHLILPAFIM